jgi:hypothetical protein
MKKKDLQALAQKIQLEIKEEELSTYLEIFEHLEKLTENFQKTKIGKQTKLMARIEIGHLTLEDLEKIKKQFSSRRVSKKTLEKNSLITEDNFILFKKPN